MPTARCRRAPKPLATRADPPEWLVGGSGTVARRRRGNQVAARGSGGAATALDDLDRAGDRGIRAMDCGSPSDSEFREAPRGGREVGDGAEGPCVTVDSGGDRSLPKSRSRRPEPSRWPIPDGFPPRVVTKPTCSESSTTNSCFTSMAPSSTRPRRTSRTPARSRGCSSSRRQPSRESNWRGWLFRVAQREAWRIERQGLDDNNHEVRPIHDFEVARRRSRVLDEIEIRNDVTEALTIIAELRPRLQRIALLRALGYTHAQVGEVTGDSARRVHQLMSRASQEVDEIRAEPRARPP